MIGPATLAAMVVPVGVPVGVLVVLAAYTPVAGLSYNTLVVLAGVAAVGFAAGLTGTLTVLRKRPLAGDAAAHATLLGVGGMFLATGRRDLPTLLAGALVAAVAALLVLVFLRRFTRTRDDAATAIVIGVSFGAGLAVVAGITARGLPGSGGLAQFLLGHTAALTARDAVVLTAASLAAVALLAAGFKEAVMVAFDADFARAAGWPVGLIDAAVVTLVAVMVVVGLPAAGAVLVTALVVIPPVAARQWTDRVGTMFLLAGTIGLAAAVAGVAASTLRPGLATGPLVVLSAAAICAVSVVFAPRRGWLGRRWREATLAGRWARGRLLEECLALADGGGGAFDSRLVRDRAGGDTAAARRRLRRAWDGLVWQAAVQPAAGGLWMLSSAGLAEARERHRRIAAWRAVLDAGLEGARDRFSLDLPPPDDPPATGAQSGSAPAAFPAGGGGP